MNKYIIKLVLLFICISTVNVNMYASDNAKFTVSAPQTVAVGESFQLIYTLNTSGRDIRVPAMDGFEIIAGPFTSTSTSMQYVNGNMTSTKTVRYTYTLLAQKQGVFNINPASIVANKQKVHTNAISIKVIAAEDKVSQKTQQKSSSNSGTNLSNDNLYIRAIPSKIKVREQESLLLTYKIYSRVDLVDIQSVKFPELKGMLVQEIENHKGITPDRENVNGKIYVTYVVKQYLVFPQGSGKVEVNPFTCDAIVRIRQKRQSRGFFADFFDSYHDVSKALKSNKVVINVEPLPQPKPLNFTGAVGKFNLETSISTNELRAHESLTLKVKIKGSGNMKLIKNPEIKFPTDFEVYEPKVNNNFSTKASGVRGAKDIEYLAIPRHDGKFNIPSFSFTYFDTDKNDYVTLNSQAYDINVLKGENTGESMVAVQANSANQELVRVLASDIRYIRTKTPQLIKSSTSFAGTVWFWMLYIISFLVAIVLLFVFRQKVKENANLALKRNKKANAMAKKRLKQAYQEMKAANKGAFYDEVLKALWGYLSDKCSMPISQLNKENVESEMIKRSVPQEKITLFISLISDCEFERYAPSSNSNDAMDRIYNSTITVISELEKSIKK